RRQCRACRPRGRCRRRRALFGVDRVSGVRRHFPAPAPPDRDGARCRSASPSDPRAVDQGAGPGRVLLTPNQQKDLSSMQTFFRLFIALSAAALLLVPPAALAQDTKKAPAKTDAPATGKDLYSTATFDFMLKQRLAQGQADTPELRAAVRDELNTRELLVREAKKKGLDKTVGTKTEMDLAAQTVLVRAFMSDYLKAHPISDEALR